MIPTDTPNAATLAAPPGPPDITRRVGRVAVAALVGALTTAGLGCGGGDGKSSLCTAAGAYRDALAATQAAGKPDVQNEAWVSAARQLGVAASNLAASAPADIKADLSPYMERLRTGDPSVRGDEKLKDIERRLQDRIATECDIVLSLE